LAEQLRARFAGQFPDLKDFGPADIAGCLAFVEDVFKDFQFPEVDVFKGYSIAEGLGGRPSKEDPRLIQPGGDGTVTFVLPGTGRAWKTAAQLSGRAVPGIERMGEEAGRIIKELRIFLRVGEEYRREEKQGEAKASRLSNKELARRLGLGEKNEKKIGRAM